jgi:hypothetical protein
LLSVWHRAQGSEDTPFVRLPEAEEEFVEKVKTLPLFACLLACLLAFGGVPAGV